MKRVHPSSKVGVEFSLGFSQLVLFNSIDLIKNVYNIKDFTFTIYNRWGEKVFETNDYLKGWNGKYKGQPAVSGAYVWYCKFNKLGILRKLKGSVILIR